MVAEPPRHLDRLYVVVLLTTIHMKVAQKELDEWYSHNTGRQLEPWQSKGKGP